MLLLLLLLALAPACLAVSVSRVESGDYGPVTAYAPPPVGPSANLIVNDVIVAPDGFVRPATVVNGGTPGPLIKINKNDPIKINVINNLTNPNLAEVTSVHWHGIFEHGRQWADGVAFVTQCPIIPNDAFTYKLNATGQTGTYWYHSHYSVQYCDGLRGPLVIYDPEDPYADMYDVDDESTVITIADWYHQPANLLNATFGAVLPDATLINGKGRYWNSTSDVDLGVIEVEQGKSYRFRIVGMQCNLYFNFTIAGHKMTVIETDGIEIDPVEVDSISVFAAQRYSVVVTANQPIDNYWIRLTSENTTSTFINGMNSAIFRYKGAPDADPTNSTVTSTTPLIDSNIHPLINPGAPGVHEIGQADVNINLDLGFNLTNTVNPYFFINNVTFFNPDVPVLLQILNGAVHPSQLLPKGSVYELLRNKVIELSLPVSSTANAAGAPHPFHLHGHVFDVIRAPGNSTPNFVNPPRRDVISTGTLGDNVTIRFVTDNSGPWFLHCHIDWHLSHGFAVVMAENPPATAAHRNDIPTSWNELCPDYNAFIAADPDNGRLLSHEFGMLPSTEEQVILSLPESHMRFGHHGLDPF
ncbi:laccase [Coniophora puteana RWD-64-598 SS2]|uniref:Laccase n=1 Tax=Coniophora puteana (strain RWD-64-598) TaxID=741705 RepID=A0A5M3M8Q6_CONPW|nr:laccase [Coniophora puteana RWD-64-598 SS2]EIW75316.1 laccase [Coniophora puteana RWD-64-598 SS2]